VQPDGNAGELAGSPVTGPIELSGSSEHAALVKCQSLPYPSHPGLVGEKIAPVYIANTFWKRFSQSLFSYSNEKSFFE